MVGIALDRFRQILLDPTQVFVLDLARGGASDGSFLGKGGEGVEVRLEGSLQGLVRAIATVGTPKGDV